MLRLVVKYAESKEVVPIGQPFVLYTLQSLLIGHFSSVHYQIFF